MSTKPMGWPPLATGDAALYQQLVLEPLLWEDKTGAFKGCLAESWTIAPDGTSVTFKLRKGVKFSDGSDFNAQAVKFNFDANIAAKKSNTVNWKSVDVVDDNTVRINLIKWGNNLLETFVGGGANAIASQAAYQKNGEEWMSQNMVGTGPFTQVSIVRDTKVVYKKNPNYWQAGLPYLDGVEYNCIADPMTAQVALKAGTLMGQAASVDQKLKELVDLGFGYKIANSGVAAFFPDSKNTSSTLANQKVREAVEYAIDKEGLVKAQSYGFYKSLDQFAPRVSTAYDPTIPGRKYDVAKAKQLLTEAGYPNGVTVNMIITVDNKEQLVAIQAMLENAGIHATTEFVDTGKFVNYSMTGWNGYYYSSPGGTSNWLSTIQSICDPNSGQSVSLDRPQEFINLFYAAQQSFEKDPVKEKAVVRYMYEHAMCIPFSEKARAWVFQSYVKGGDFMDYAGTGTWSSFNVWLDK